MGLLDTLLGHAGEKDITGLHAEFGPLLAKDEALQRAFGFVRDLIVFTDRRMIIVDKQGVTGKKTAYLSIPYRAIVMYSIETAGHFDLDSDLRIWVSGQAEPITRALGRGAGVRDIIAILAQATR
ncbi:PH domain-containing protein [Cognatilysobacter lacus]|uniref:PH domain-containing protein n=1 Tax=Cognatilysobacter lacus TaxID=1643323 RepID=A0A5D8Z449_9GAMM|nr:PH domain-containing protein [Lysobacter lacus]TZF89708.1 PH domain-containing protein [Lysobacter lacus]